MLFNLVVITLLLSCIGTAPIAVSIVYKGQVRSTLKTLTAAQQTPLLGT